MEEFSLSEIIKFFEEHGKTTGIIGIVLGIILTKFFPWLSRKLKSLFSLLKSLVTGRYREKQFEKKYLSQIIERHQYLGLIPTTQVVPKNKGLRLADLEKIYTTLSFVPDNIVEQPVRPKPDELDMEKMMRRKKRFRFRKEIIPDEMELGRLILNNDRLVIKGDPGSGKTTLLRYLALSCARALRQDKVEGDDDKILMKRLGWSSRFFPIFISLINISDKKSWGADDSLYDLFRAQLDVELRKQCPENFFRNKLKKGGCLILLDAFDELGTVEARKAVADKTGALAGEYKNNNVKIIATTRHIGYEDQLDAYQFINYKIQDLDEGSRQRLVKQRFRAIAIEECQGKTKQKSAAIENNYRQKAESLLSSVKLNTHLRELTHNPLLLTLIVLIHAAGIPMPDQRHELYRDCVLVLADKWRAGKLKQAGITNQDREIVITTDEKVKLLASLAWRMQLSRKQADEHSLIPHCDAQQLITDKLKNDIKLPIPKNVVRPDRYHATIAASLLEDIKTQSGILVEKGNDVETNEPLIAFSHLSFQEYLCAFCIHEKKELRPELFLNLVEPAWQEVVRLYRTISGEEQIIVTLLSDSANQPDGLLLAAACMAEYDRGVDEKIKHEISDRMKECIIGLKQNIQKQFLVSLIKIGGAEHINLLLNLALEQDEAFALKLFDALGSLELDIPFKKAIAQRLLNLLNSPEKLTFKSKVAVGQAVEKLGDPRFETAEPAMVPVAAGQFCFGDDKKPKSLPAFSIGKYPVTNMEYKRFIDATGHPAPHDWKDGFYPAGKANHPVIYVDKRDAELYCQWLTQKSESGKKYRLPTEFEWEKAARGVDGKEYPWGDSFDKSKCNSFSQNEGTSPVGVFVEDNSEFSVLDAAGNVWEWTSSPYEFWDDVKLRLPILRKNSQTVVRGGSWDDYLEYLFRCAVRGWSRPDDRGIYLGFRVVCSAG